MADKTVKAVVLKDFRDAGSEREFAKDATVDVTEGEFTNYAAAGLVRDPGAKADPAPVATA